MIQKQQSSPVHHTLQGRSAAFYSKIRRLLTQERHRTFNELDFFPAVKEKVGGGASHDEYSFIHDGPPINIAGFTYVFSTSVVVL